MGDHVFISYSRVDRSYVDKLATYLTGEGVEVWFDYEIGSGERFVRVIEHRIRTARALVLVVSPDSSDSAWVEREIHFAAAHHVDILPVLLRGTALPLLVCHLHYEDVRTGQMPGPDFIRRLTAGRASVTPSDANRTPSTGQKPVVADPPPAPSLPDDHPIWKHHSGNDGHRFRPEWNAGADLSAAEAFYRRSSSKAKVLLDLLIDNPGRVLTTHQICEESGGAFSGARSIAGAINGMYRPHERSGRRYPFYWWSGAPAQYAMKPSVARLFSEARRLSGLEESG
ncbi:DUF6416 domain-containing protein [Actinoplanes sp. URMC 104]|uniref:DUF6416 domain-containing protein n=1 Tax=Actinoplanes sp. URMC 104 TaxID=3423409 RepID=UPI003F1A9E74